MQLAFGDESDRIDELTRGMPRDLRATVMGLAQAAAHRQIDHCRWSGLPLETVATVLSLATEIVTSEIRRLDRERKT
jgi:hypothetical protein